MLVTNGQLVYLAMACVITCAACALAVRHRASFALFQQGYRAQLLSRPRLVLFATAWAAFVVLAPLTGDPTWDAIDASFMSIGCYALAPWTLGVLYRAKRESMREVVVAIVLSLFVSSWSYDLYLVVRDGVFPPTSVPNLFASLILYVLGGLFFSLGEHGERGLVFVFMDSRWPAWSGDRWTLRVAGRAAVLASLIAAPVVVFLVWVVLSELQLWPS